MGILSDLYNQTRLRDKNKNQEESDNDSNTSVGEVTDENKKETK